LKPAIIIHRTCLRAFAALVFCSTVAWPANLIVNPGNELPLISGDIQGWTEVQGSAWTRSSIVPAQEGVFHFEAGEVANAELAQSVDVSSFALGIDAGVQRFNFSGYVRSFPQSPLDLARIVVEYRNAGGVVLSTFDSGEVANGDSWQLVSDSRLAPAGTRRINVRLIARRLNGTFNDGFFDNIQLEPGVTGMTGLRFVPVTPCRLVDTRNNPGPFGGPALAGGAVREFNIPQQPVCGIPAAAAAYSLNVTVVPTTGNLGFLTVWPTGQAQPFVSTLNSIDGRIKANAAIVPAGAGGAISVFVNNATQLVLDINGYFIDPAINGQSLAFYPLTPCRILDTRNPNSGPAIPAGGTLTIPMLSSNCGIPGNAQAYSVNATVVPLGPSLGFLTLWANGQLQPFVSTLNSLTGAIVANAALVPAGNSGSINAFATDQTHLVLDVNGYFAPPGAANAQRYFAVTPCRLLDTRLANGEFGGPILEAGQQRSYRLPVANCSLPGTATAFSLNATVVPTAGLGFLTLWPFGTVQPLVSTLNASNDPIVANAAIVAAGSSGAVASFANGQTHLIIDTNGYFAP
jgi:hypothetical protein